ncbi:MAG: M3 family oligoendopeptidase [Ardenticatenaceae bacterium]|nr:M3 family oligoendopeptidase [Ardenticatenaceae bacterium]MCB8990006.1 M3 family oligoendopeptidase [Ardenticatenaceae bacterium]
MTPTETPQTGAETVRWDLSDLYSSPDDPQLTNDMDKARELAAAFADRYRGKVASLSAAELAQALAEFEAILRLLYQIGTYAFLAWSVDTQNPELGKLMARKDAHSTEIEQLVLFFELEWANAPEATAQLADAPALARYSHYLKQQRLLQPYTLSEPEEKVISQLSLTGSQGWYRFFDEVTSKLTYTVDGKELTYAENAELLFSPDRDVRQKAADAFTAVFNANSHTFTYIYNMVLLDKSSKDKMRGYASWITARNLANQVADETVEALVTAVTDRYDIVARYYRLLQKQLGYDELFDYDRYAPIGGEEPKVTWGAARDIVLQAFGQFDPRMADIARKFFDNNWIDAPTQVGKMGGAYCQSTTTEKHPYVFMNFNGEMGQVMTLAHELGHGIHGYLAQQQGELQANTPITTAEMASTFGEMLVFDYLIQQQPDPAQRLAMRMRKMAETFATVERQIALNRFEHAIHTARREQGELDTTQFNELWLETQRALFGDSLTIRDDYKTWWMPISHFISMHGYVYGYAFGELLVWALYAHYKQQPEGFADRYMDVLSAGGSDWPHKILAPLGVDLQDPNFWHEGLDLFEQFIADMEADAEA